MLVVWRTSGAQVTLNSDKSALKEPRQEQPVPAAVSTSARGSHGAPPAAVSREGRMDRAQVPCVFVFVT